MQNSKVKIALAPMAGITDSVFRLLNIFGGTDLVYSEMAHVNAISYSSKKTLGMLKASPFESLYIVQLFGKDPKYFAEATRIISKQGVPIMQYEPFSERQMEFIEKLNSETGSRKQDKIQFQTFYSRFLAFQKQLPTFDSGLGTGHLIPAGLDINLGCPAKKVFGHGGGAALWKDLENVRAILEAVLNNTDLPLSIKVRTAVGEITLIDLLDHIKDLPIKRIMIHGRTYTQGFSGPIDTKIIRKVIKKYPQFEFWVNGGIVDTESANKIIEDSKCANIGIARGALGNPLLAEEIKGNNNSVARQLLSSVAISCVLAYIHSVLAHQSKEKHGIVEMRKHLAWYFKDFPGAKEWRKKLVTVKTLKEIEEILSKIVVI